MAMVINEAAAKVDFFLTGTNAMKNFSKKT